MGIRFPGSVCFREKEERPKHLSLLFFWEVDQHFISAASIVALNHLTATLQNLIRSGRDVDVLERVSVGVDEAAVHLLCVQSDSTVEFVLLFIKRIINLFIVDEW